jgi:N-carbamoyl-L-amino-acid hydrolase
MAETGNLRVDGKRLWDSLMTMGEIGATPAGGVRRLALTEVDQAARDRFVEWCEAAGLNVRVDRLGNIFARREGRDADRPPVLIGSHLDSQPAGGRFDGAYGVLAAFEVIRVLNDAGIETEAPIELVNWSDEEGCRFGGGLWGSGGFSGRIAVEDALAITDWDGIAVGEALRQIGYAGEAAVGAPVDCFLECHIEQGPRLENAGLSVGVVTGASAQRVYRVTVKGKEGHGGTVPMADRQDALLGAARMVDALHRLAVETDPEMVLTIGTFHVLPNGRSTIPGEVMFAIDNRHPEDALLDQTGVAIPKLCQKIADELGLGLDLRTQSARAAVRFDPALGDLLRGKAKSIGLGFLDLTSGAGHDACNLALLAPSAMIFVPCRDGVSHREDEWAEADDLEAGANLLLQAVLARAG